MSKTQLEGTLILLRGWNAKTSDAHNKTWEGLEEYLTESGFDHFVPNSHRLDGLEKRADDVIKDIAKQYPGGKKRVHLVAHSFGGLIAREIAARSCTEETFPFVVLTVTTFGTPHRGVSYVKPPRRLSKGLAFFAQALFDRDLLGLLNLSRAAVAEFNEKMLDKLNQTDDRVFTWLEDQWHNSVVTEEPDQYEEAKPVLRRAPVRYFSWAADSEHPLGDILRKPGDKVVSVRSATWGPDLGPGTHLGTVRGLTHATIVSVALVVKSMPHWKAAEDGRPPLPVENLEEKPHEGFRENFKSHARHFIDRFAHRK